VTGFRQREHSVDVYAVGGGFGEAQHLGRARLLVVQFLNLAAGTDIAGGAQQAAEVNTWGVVVHAFHDSALTAEGTVKGHDKHADIQEKREYSWPYAVGRRRPVMARLGGGRSLQVFAEKGIPSPRSRLEA
jgi:hypothetical protein